jgi:CTP synthase
MSPYEHGECYVCSDGWEADLDLGNYERMLDISLERHNSITSGKIYANVLDKERRGAYLGRTVQMIPHVSGEIIHWIETVAQNTFAEVLDNAPCFMLIELGGSVGDIETGIFSEALRQLRTKVGAANFVTMHVSLVPLVSGQHKTKPAQRSCIESRALGLGPDFVLARSETPISQEAIEKLALFCSVPTENVVSLPNVANLYRVPLLLAKQGVVRAMASHMGFEIDDAVKAKGMSKWETLAAREEAPKYSPVNIAIVGKYASDAGDSHDSYLSVTKALEHAGNAVERKVQLTWVAATALEEGDRDAWKALKAADGVLVPGGFSSRGVEGKIAAVHWARKSGVPFLGICLGMQCAVIEYARNVMGWKDANSEEFVADSQLLTSPAHLVLRHLPDVSREYMGANMRLGAQKMKVVVEGSLLQEIYGGAMEMVERHRHRYEVNPDVVAEMSAAGMVFSGIDMTGVRYGACELPRNVHPWFFGLQAHPEFTSRPGRPSPPFLGFVQAASRGPTMVQTSEHTSSVPVSLAAKMEE